MPVFLADQRGLSAWVFGLLSPLRAQRRLPARWEV
jgi:hypothetical protein